MPPRILPSGHTLGPDHTLESGNRRYSLVMQTDGNLVLYESEGGARWPRWASSTYTPGSRLDMYPDGNLVIHGPGGEVCWNETQTGGHPGAFLMIQNDGNIAMYQPGTLLWSTQTSSIDYNTKLMKHLVSTQIRPDEELLMWVAYDQFWSPAVGYGRCIGAVTTQRFIIAPEDEPAPEPAVTIEFSRQWTDIAEIDYRPQEGEGYIVSTSGGKWPILGYGMIPPPEYGEFVETMRRALKQAQAANP